MRYSFKKYQLSLIAVFMIFAVLTASVYGASGNIKDVTREATLSRDFSTSSETETANEVTWTENTVDASGYSNYYAQIIAESLEDLRDYKESGGDIDRIYLNLDNKIDMAILRKSSMSSADIAEVNQVLDAVQGEIQGIESFEFLNEKIDEFKKDIPNSFSTADENWSVTEEKEDADSKEQSIGNTTLAQSFSDVNPGDWFYDTIMEMTKRGLFAGKGEIINGEGTFAPYDVMTRAEFNAVLCRALFGDVSNQPVEGKPWWYKSDSLLRGRAIIGMYDFPEGVDVPMSREEMAYMSANTFIWGKIWNLKLSENPIVYANLDGARDKIPDYNTISENYIQSVIECYSQGILCGVDQSGSFNPKGYLTRAEATSVLYRLLEREARTPVDLSVKFDTVGVADPNVPITIYEGRLRVNRFAKEGDTVIKEDGTQVVLKFGPHGILGEGQPVAADLGMQVDINSSSSVVRAGNGGNTYYGETDHKDRTGKNIRGQKYLVNYITGEAHWYYEWEAMCAEPQTTGTFDYQLSSDRNWLWDADWDEWTPVYIHPLPKEGIEKILFVNGLK